MSELGTKQMRHNLILENRKNLSLTGVNDVQGFDEQTINLVTDYGTLIIKGTMLHINKLNLESKEVCVDGNISSLQYINNTKNMKSRLFR